MHFLFIVCISIEQKFFAVSNKCALFFEELMSLKNILMLAYFDKKRGIITHFNISFMLSLYMNKK